MIATATFARFVASLGIATIALAGTARPMLAADEPAYGYTVNVSAFVACDAAAGTMDVSATGTTFQAQGSLGPTLGIYDAGQWVRYNVWSRELGASQWTQVYNWSDWQWIVAFKDLGGGVSMVSPQPLGTSSVTGAAGHSYEVLVQVDYWTGQSNLYDVNPSYSQRMPVVFGGYISTVGYCHL